MRQFSNEEKNRLSKLGRDYLDKWRKDRDAAYNKFDERLKAFADDTKLPSFQEGSSELFIKLRDGLADGTYKKPSEFFEENARDLFNGWIYPCRKEAFYHTVDKLSSWIYSTSYRRRSMRTNNPEMIARRVMNITYSFYERDHFEDDICDILEEKLSEEKLGHMLFNYYNYGGFFPYVIAAEIDAGNSRMIDILKDSINSESDVITSRAMISGIFMSSSHELYELVGKLLEAARLQEGLRQAICEAMDEGTAEGFKTLLEVIYKNGYIRFSSIKRAVGTWLGLLDDETAKLDRISDKSIELVYNAINYPNKREEYLASEDCMKIHVALWAYGFDETDMLIEKINELSLSGTRHQVLAASYMAGQLDNSRLMHRAAYNVISAYSDDHEIMAAYMPCFMSGVMNKISLFGSRYNSSKDTSIYKERRYCDISDYFENNSEAEKYYSILGKIRSSFKGKELVFSPCIFPWNTEKLEKSDIVIRMAVIASGLRSNEMTDELCGILSEIDTWSRDHVVEMLLTQPESKLQMKTLTAALCDKSENTRSVAFKIMGQVQIMPENYMQMEEMLKYKAADARTNIISLLYKQDDELLFGTVSRLIGDKKEEKRTAALDIIMQLVKDTARSVLADKCKVLTASLKEPTTKEKILIDNIMGADKENEAESERLFDEADVYVPQIPDNSYTNECIELFMHYFPESQVGSMLSENFSKPDGNGEAYRQAAADIKALTDFIVLHEKDEFIGSNGETFVVGCAPHQFHERIEGYLCTVPLYSLWKGWFEENIASAERLAAMYVLAAAYTKTSVYTDEVSPVAEQLYGKGFDVLPSEKYIYHARDIINKLADEFISNDIFERLAAAEALWFIKCVPDDKVFILDEPSYGNKREEVPVISHAQIICIMGRLNCRNNEHIAETLPLAVSVAKKAISNKPDTPNYMRNRLNIPRVNYSSNGYNIRFDVPSLNAYLIAADRGVISKRTLFAYIFDENNISAALDNITSLIMAVRERDRQISARGVSYSWRNNRKLMAIRTLTGSENPDEDENRSLIELGTEVYSAVISQVLASELKRGDTPALYSKVISSINRIYGLDNFIAILSALGKDTLERSTYVSSGDSKKQTLSHLLAVCIPDENDNAEKLGEMIKATDITEQRLIEAALYSPEWIGIVGEYLKWEGFTSACYYFMAHMNERFDERRKAVIAKYTPLTDEELNLGAFDINWFRSAFDALGEKRFDMVYDAAKYISDGAKHSRARKYADAVLGRADKAKAAAAIADKRNKDLLMSYTLIPLGGEDDICERYLFLQKFLKESRKFGAQRSASEKKAVEISMQNLAINAGYADVTRLTLRMETKLIDDSRELFEDKQIDDIVIRLNVTEDGKCEVSVSKNGKALKSVPAKLKKNEYIVRINETKKNLTEQYRRTRLMFEQSMEDCIEFSVGELKILRENPVVFPIIKNLVFAKGGSLGFLDGNKLTDYAGNSTVLSDEDKVITAHPFALYTDGHWSDYQRYLFDNSIVQPFKQVFRELYIKTEEEKTVSSSRRYSGNQIQPARTAVCLKSRRWIADVEDGLQKVYYNENIVAKIYAMADWFSPADIEAPALEWVEFTHRKTGSPILISEIPDIIFSEVMRDVDMAVSVAHAGGVDPETSHSTVEMRSALVELTMPMFKLKNVRTEKNHAFIDGKYGSYSVHLGSGVIHKMGGAMINILPVHSQHRGKLFLPFADEDPKTAEILTKIILLAEDGKIKDPQILSQLTD